MRKFLCIALICCAGWIQAGDYAYMVFTDNLGNHLSLPVNNLTMTISNGELQATTDEGKATFILVNLVSMQFSKDAELQSLANVLDGDQPIDVYTPLGTKVGRYDNLLKAVGTLPKGAYVITDGTNSQTIVLR
ncbi:MAG: hypothetical protein IKS76_05325 [Paludibacteraceae bacterium]|nr:hypothetical protein [Paludibacteraceae bacterium]MBR6493272.1 hypothetical protein [Paludibacteraceae bacterium]